MSRVPIMLFISAPGHTKYLEFNGSKWVLHRETYRELVFRCADAGLELHRTKLSSAYVQTPHGIADVFSPFAVVGNKFDLDTYNTWFFDRMAEIQEIDKSAHVADLYNILDGADLPGFRWSKNVPWVNNIQGLTLSKAEIKPIVKKLFCDIIKMGGSKSWYSLGNEVDNPVFVPLFRDVVIPLITSGMLDPSHMTYGPTLPTWEYLGGGQYPDKVNDKTLGTLKEMTGTLLGDRVKAQIYREIHGVDIPPYDKWRPFGAHIHQAIEGWGGAGHPIKIVASNDAAKLKLTDPRASDCDIAEGEARISREEWRKLTRYILKGYPPEGGGLRARVILEACPQTEDAICIAGSIKAISQGIHDELGEWSTWYGKVPYVPEPPPPPIPPDPPDPPAPPQPPEPPVPPTPPIPRAPKCSCWGWLWKRDFKRWGACLFKGGPKHCK